MASRVYVTGIGMISAIGENIIESLTSLHAGKTGIGEIRFLPTRHKGSLPVGEVGYSYEALCQMAAVPLEENFPRTALLGILAAREALEHANIYDPEGDSLGLISGTTVGGMDKSEELYSDYLGENKRHDLSNVITHDCGDTTEKIADTLGIREYVSTISTACSSGANAIMMGARLIKSGILDRVLVGGTDALTRFTLNGFKSLLILSDEWCKPFDAERKGLNLGEGAGYLVLESEAAVKKSGKPILCELTGYANTADAYHQTASSPDGRGARMAMEKALAKSGLATGDIDYINAHGTATPNNDLSEGAAIRAVFGENLPPVSSTKSFTGHTLGAAGGIEAVISVLAIQYGLIFPNLNYESSMEELDFEPQQKLVTGAKVRSVLSNSFGFGGNCTSLIFSRIK
ncbi:beta-ketoacyl-[acyl-carrier-protein] synthase family protein [bacterium]|nr:beta-ketoacyl-[acyl-carrier-protein] synthase family protein [bacterium]